MVDGSKKRMTMKKIFNIMFAAVAICFSAACQKEEIKDTVNSAIVGEWHLSTVEVDGTIQKYAIDVYLTINSDCTFELYQKSGTEMRYTKYSGSCKTEGNIFTGKYISGRPLNGAPYTFSIEGGNLILMTADGLEVQEYTKGSLSQEDKLAADISTKAVSEVAPIL